MEIHVEQVVLHGRHDTAAVEHAIVEQVSAALEERGLDPVLASGGADLVHARAHAESPGAVGRTIAAALPDGGAP